LNTGAEAHACPGERARTRATMART
jgi:hypothetical protein